MRTVFLLLLCFATAPAFADDNKVIYRKEEKHQFQGTKLKGQVKKPDLTYIYRRQGLRAEKILKIPDNFDDEILFDASQF